ncbi:MAG: hypothetical protein NTW62_00320 [Candidatus Nomurabacteria bacterium]|nr:hypothetical protein [Candidatus Nomurabacteria bacterium]
MEKIEELFKSEYIDIPEINAAKSINKAEVKFANIKMFLKKREKISFDPNKKKRIVFCKINGQINFEEAIEYITSRKGIFPNVEGLFAALSIIDNKVPLNKNVPIFGFDIDAKLWEPDPDRKALFVPIIVIKKDCLYFGLSSFGSRPNMPCTENMYLIYFIE